MSARSLVAIALSLATSVAEPACSGGGTCPAPKVAAGGGNVMLQENRTHALGTLVAQEDTETTCEDWPSLSAFPEPDGKDATVSLQRGKYKLAGSSTTQLGKLVVGEGAELHFHNKFSGELQVKSIEVRGKLVMGTSACPLEGPATVTFRPPSKSLTVLGSGTWIMHGQPYEHTWVRLSQSARAGDTKIWLQSAVDWEAGQQIVLLTTVMLDTPEKHQNEVMEIKDVTNGGRALVLEQPLKYLHYAGEEYQGEVALLSRSITLQGDASSKDTQQGVTTVCKGGAVCQLSYAQAFRAGHYNTHAMYPFHFHMMKNVRHESFMNGLSVFRSYFRAYTIHGTSSTTLSDSVAFDVIGTAVYMEDAVEEDCLIARNLIAHVARIKPIDRWRTGKGSPSDYLFPEKGRIDPIDETAAPFYCPNPKNRWIDNVASGGFAGFIFVSARQKTGDSRTDSSFNVNSPMSNELQLFRGNTVHSSGSEWDQGACIYFGGDVKNQKDKSGKFVKTYNWGRTTDMPRGRAVLENTRFYACRFGMEVWGTTKDKRPQVLLVDTLSADVMTSVRLLGMNAVQGGTIHGRTANTKVFDGVTWDTFTGNKPAKKGEPWGVCGIRLYDTVAQILVGGVTFAGFNGPNDAAVIQPIMFTDFTTQGQSVLDIRFKGTPTVNRLTLDRGAGHCSSNDMGCHSSQNGNVIDVAGSFVGTGEATVWGAGNDVCRTACKTNDWWKLDDNCEQHFPEMWPTGKGQSTSRSGGWWACPAQSPKRWASPAEPRHVVSLGLASTAEFLRVQDPVTTEEGRSMRSLATKHVPKRLDTLATGIIHHFGHEGRRLQIGFPMQGRSGKEANSPAFQATGVCCDIGWYFFPEAGGQRGKSFNELYIGLEQVGPSGLIFAASYPKSAKLTITREFGVKNQGDYKKEIIARTLSRRTFMAQPGTAYFYDESSGNVFLKLVNPRAEKFDMGGGLWEYHNNFVDQPRYMIAANSAKVVDFALPPKQWIADAMDEECFTKLVDKKYASPGTTLDTLVASTTIKCEDACLAMQGCNTFIYNANIQQCTFKNKEGGGTSTLNEVGKTTYVLKGSCGM